MWAKEGRNVCRGGMCAGEVVPAKKAQNMQETAKPCATFVQRGSASQRCLKPALGTRNYSSSPFPSTGVQSRGSSYPEVLLTTGAPAVEVRVGVVVVVVIVVMIESIIAE